MPDDDPRERYSAPVDTGKWKMRLVAGKWVPIPAGAWVPYDAILLGPSEYDSRRIGYIGRQGNTRLNRVFPLSFRQGDDGWVIIADGTRSIRAPIPDGMYLMVNPVARRRVRR